MTTGNPEKLIVRFTLPVFIGNVFQQFYSMVDAVIVWKICQYEGFGRRWSYRDNQNFLIIDFLLGLTAGFYCFDSSEIWCG